MSTPLGASLSSLKLIRDLVKEYQASIDDPDITPSDHQNIAAEMDNLVHLTQQWMEKATAHIRSLRLHTRDLQQEHAQDFSVLQTIEDVHLLLAHRLRLSRCTLTVPCPTPQSVLYGDPSKLGQVLTNLVVNAIDAYKEAGTPGGDIRIEINEEPQLLEIRVRDQGCGIANKNRDKIFDELFSTKPLGEGTGLGLSIARDIITNFFGGTIQLESVLGQGSTFLLRLPRRHSPQTQHAPMPG
jgi:signal transduction histidine kinase